MGHWSVEALLPGPHPIVIQTDHAPLRHLPNQTSVNSRVWHWLAVLQGYNVDIRHIPGKKNPADSLSRQLIADALVRKGSVKDANAEYVQKLRVSSIATDQEIQNALHELFKTGSPQGTQVQSSQSPQGSILSMNEDTGPQGTDSRPTVVAATAISKIQLDNVLKNSLYSSLQHEVPYAEILKELSGGMNQVRKNNLIFKR